MRWMMILFLVPAACGGETEKEPKATEKTKTEEPKQKEAPTKKKKLDSNGHGFAVTVVRGKGGRDLVLVEEASGRETNLGRIMPGRVVAPGHTWTWSPDGKALVFRRIELADTSQGYRSTLWHLNLAAPEPNRIAEGLSPVFSPDGARLAWIAYAEGNRRDLFVAGADGSNPKPLGVQEEIYVNIIGKPVFRWSEDGSSITFPTGAGKQTGEATVDVP